MDLREAVRAIVRSITRDLIYERTWACTVQAQNDDDTLDLLPDDERVRGQGLQRVPIRYGLPGVKAKVVAGARVLLGFEAGDPQRPFAHLWDPGAIEEITFDGGQAPIARQGDPVNVYWPQMIPVTGAVTLGPVVGTFAGTMSIGTQSAGQIAGGAPRVKA